MATPPTREKLEEWYDENYFLDYPRHDRRIRQILRNLSFTPSDRICEFGCGLGHILFAIAPLIGNGIGFDFSEFAIAEAERRCKAAAIDNLAFKAIDIETLVTDELFRGQFDKVLMMDISEHLYDETLMRFLAAAHHVLVPGGELYVHTPNAGYYLERLKSRNIILKQFPSHIAVRGRQAYEAALLSTGFRVEKVTMLPHYNFALGKLDNLMIRLPYIRHLFMSRILIKARVID
jgi:2-polyprenyl-6-hydroxyphenyl methylase / 3-demethylubiquinone-9 3-methyltransferase